MMIRGLILSALVAVSVGCASNGVRREGMALPETTTTQLGDLVRAGILIGERDAEKAEQFGNLASQLAGSLTPSEQMSLETERSLGSGVAIRAIDQIGQLHPSNELQRYVNLVGRGIARHSSRPTVPYSFGVLVNDAPNAFAGPGGYIFVTTGALDLMQDEAQLAGVLAHEIAHVTGRHMLKTYRRTQFLDAVSRGASAMSDSAAEYASLVDESTTVLFDRGLDSKFEYEADDLGVELAALAGYDPRGIVEFLRAMNTRSQGRSGGWLSTHPPTSQRIQRLERRLATDLAGIQGARNQPRFQETIRTAAGR
jgi:beta-barrel assembly-enhancing protease